MLPEHRLIRVGSCVASSSEDKQPHRVERVYFARKSKLLRCEKCACRTNIYISSVNNETPLSRVLAALLSAFNATASSVAFSILASSAASASSMSSGSYAGAPAVTSGGFLTKPGGEISGVRYETGATF